MRAPRSLRRDLAFGVGGGVAALWLLALLGAWVVLGNEVNEIYDAALKQTAHRFVHLGSGEVDPPRPPSRRRHEDLSYLQRDSDGATVTQSDGAEPALFGPAAQEGFRTRQDYRIFGLRLPYGGVIEVADPLVERRDAAREALLALLVPGVALLPLIFFGVAWFVGTRLRPVARLVDKVALRDSGDLRPLSTPGLQIELIPVRDAVNRLMGRLADAMAAERVFSANAAHELRTPIAAALAQTQRLITQAPEGPLRVRAQSIETELKRMSRLSEKLLDLARAEAAGVAGGSDQDLRAVLSLVAGDFQTKAPDLRLTVPGAPVVAAIDPDAFAILARNLIENAVLHGSPPVEVTLDPDGAFRVTNGGAPLTPDSLARLTRRFERLGSRAEGSGLGLAIVEALVRNAGARLDLRSPAPGRADGLAAEVVLPPLRPSAP